MPDDLDKLDGLDALDRLDGGGGGLDALDQMDALDRLPDPTGAEPPQANPSQQSVPTGNIEQDLADDADKMLEGFKQRARAEDERLNFVLDSEYWTALCFQSREQAEAFARAIGAWDPELKVVDGVKVAAKLGIPLPARPANHAFQQRPDYKLNAISLTEEELTDTLGEDDPHPPKEA